MSASQPLLPPRRLAWPLRIAVAVVPLLALLPLAQLATDWIELARVVKVPLDPLPVRGFDWARWEDQDGEIVAAYVHPDGSAYSAGLREGARLFQLDYQQFFSADDVERVIERSSDTMLTYEVIQDGERELIDVKLSRYPTFLYPLSGALWIGSRWAFALAAFLHVLALLIVMPLASRSRRARFSALMILSALVWVGGTLVRLLFISVAGPPSHAQQAFAVGFEVLTLLSLAGWLLFPALLLQYVLLDTRPLRNLTHWLRPLLFLPPVLIGGALAVATARGSLGPLPPDALLPPLLFYVCCYVAAATALILIAPLYLRSSEDAHPAPAWSRLGSSVVLALAVAGALFVQGALPLLTAEDDARAGAFIVMVQLFSVAPVVLVSLASLRYGRFDAVLTRALASTAVLGTIFFAFVGGLWIIRSLGPVGASESPMVLGLWVIAVLVLAERLARPARRLFGDLIRTERQRARQALNRFGDRVRTFFDVDQLAEEAVGVIGRALDARSAVLYLRAGVQSSQERWIRATFQPEAPFFTHEELTRVWSRLQAERQVWARNPELNESSLDAIDTQRMRAFGVSLAVPVTSGRGEPVGVLVLGHKARRGAVYNLEDVEMLRALCGQLALATERLGLLERERMLVRESAEAQLAALRAQINPHFLFNALNTIAALIAEKPAEAETTVEQLANLFRHVLRTGSRPFVELADELHLVRQYLAIEKARFGSKLTLQEHWQEGTARLLVPAFALQTLVENAVKHGIERTREGGTIRLEGHQLDDGSLVIEVSDTGPGIPILFHAGAADMPPEIAPRASGTALPSFYGIGLRNVAQRLEQLYGRTDLLTLSSAPDTGTQARLIVPSPPAQHQAELV